MKNTMKKRPVNRETASEIDETVLLYSSWLALLLKRLGNTEIRVSRQELKDALAGLHCAIGRDGDDYLIYPCGADEFFASRDSGEGNT